MHRPSSLILTLVWACSSNQSPSNGEEAVYRIVTCRGSAHAPAGEAFRVAVRSPAVIRDLDGLIGQGAQRIVSGQIRTGAGGVNQPWSWHLDPATVQVVDNAIELCDGCPSFVEADLAAWLQIGSYCPWTSEVAARER